MGRVIKHTDLIESNVFKPATKNAQALLSVTKEVTKEFINLLKTSNKKIGSNFQKTAAEIKKFNEETVKSNKLIKF